MERSSSKIARAERKVFMDEKRKRRRTLSGPNAETMPKRSPLQDIIHRISSNNTFFGISRETRNKGENVLTQFVDPLENQLKNSAKGSGVSAPAQISSVPAGMLSDYLTSTLNNTDSQRHYINHNEQILEENASITFLRPMTDKATAASARKERATKFLHKRHNQGQIRMNNENIQPKVLRSRSNQMRILPGSWNASASMGSLSIDATSKRSP
ncbi:hypothetical protein PIB30_045762 [Stylosanthes scabra]|uniref:Uncharacterized protein n=1 Tax=Stylosanthes scabra TaxID=79078 RepID=A0ABU6TFX9_9FABA|nr:hypothetical protein [Stylosanthes scabra]